MAAEVTSRLDEIFLEDDPPAPPSRRPSSAAPLAQSQMAAESDAALEFSEPEPTSKAETLGGAADISAPPTSQDPLAELNTLFLSIDWEITDENMTALIGEVQKLKSRYQNNRLISALLDILNTIGKYVARNKVDSIPDSIKLLHEVFDSLKAAFQSPRMDQMAQKQLLGQHLQSLKRIREAISLRGGGGKPVAAAAKASPRAAVAAAGRGGAATPLSDSDMQRLLEALKPMVLAEMHKLVAAEMKRLGLELG